MANANGSKHSGTADTMSQPKNCALRSPATAPSLPDSSPRREESGAALRVLAPVDDTEISGSELAHLQTVGRRPQAYR